MGDNLLTMRVTSRTREALDVWSFELAPVGCLPLPEFEAGAHIDVHVGGVVRQYSLCNAPGQDDRFRIAVQRCPRGHGGSVKLCDTVDVGDELQIGGPRNHFGLEPSARRSLLLAGGIGITPILAMARELSARGADFELHYSCRSRERTAFEDLLRAGPWAERIVFHRKDEPGEQRLDIARAVAEPSPDTHLYMCGPAAYIDAVRSAAAQAHWLPANVHCEFFANDLGDKPDDSTSFRVRIASTGEMIAVSADRSILDALAEAGVHVEVSCQQGVCGSCLTRVLDGIPDHQDLYLTDAEHAANDQMTPCCSRAKSAILVLDL